MEFERSILHILIVIFLLPTLLPIYLVVDTYLLARAMVRAFVPSALGWFHRVRGWDPQTTPLDLQCISWMLQTSLDKATHLLTLRLLATITTLTTFHPALVSTCLDILTGGISIIDDGKARILQGSEEVVIASALCCLHALSHLTTMDPASNVFKDVRRWYTKTFPIWTNFEGIPSYHHFCIIHNVFHPYRKRISILGRGFQTVYRSKIQWRDYKLSSTEPVVLVQLARLRYQGREPRKVPRWILQFARHLLSQDPLPPVSVVANCLSIIAMDLDRAVSNVTTRDERYVHT